nr:TonB-dependent receptor [Sphingomonas sp. CDS-1]
MDSYEIGLKTDFFDRRVRLNLALFQNDIKNPQVQTIINTGALGVVGLTNAQKARSRGVEADANILVTQGLTARLAGTCLDAKYIEFTNAPFNFPPTDPVTGAIISPFGLLAPVLGDASGNRLARVPKFRFSAGINYDVKAEFGHVIFDASVAYTAKFAFDADNRIVQPHYALANASISYSPTVEDRWTVRAWMNNITNKKYYLNELPVANGSGNISAPAAPRTYGVEVGVKF